jgi:hypothetical protein
MGFSPGQKSVHRTLFCPPFGRAALFESQIRNIKEEDTLWVSSSFMAKLLQVDTMHSLGEEGPDGFV